MATPTSKTDADVSHQCPDANFVVWLGAITILALLLRVFHLDYQSLFRDEGHTFFLATGPWWQIGKLTQQGNYPPLYFVLTKIFAATLGDTVLAIRAISCIAGTLTIPLAGLIAWRVSSEAPRRSALFTALVMACSCYFVACSQEARAYSLFGCLATAFAAVVVWERELPPRHSQLVLVILATLLLYTDFLAVPTLVLACLVNSRLRLPVVVAALLSLPILFYTFSYIYTLLGHGMDPRDFGLPPELRPPAAIHSGRLPLSALVINLITMPIALISNISGGSGKQLLWMAITAAVCATALVSGSQGRRLATAGFALLAISVAMNWRYGQMSTAASRLAMVAPILVTALCVATATSRFRFRSFLMLCLFVVSSVPTVRYLTRPERGGWKQLGHWMQEHGNRETVHCSAYDGVMLRHYYPRVRSDRVSPGQEYYWAGDHPEGIPGEILTQQLFVNVSLLRLRSPGLNR